MKPKRIKSDFSDILDYGINLEARKIYLTDEVDRDSVYLATTGLDLLIQQDATKPITIFMNSYGGDVYRGFALYDAIKNCPAHVTMVGTGAVMSMGAMLLQAADERLLTPNAAVMIHHGYTGGWEGDLKSFIAWGEFEKKTIKRCNEILAARTGKSPSFWDRRQDHDFILTAEEAVALGLADRIVEMV